MGLSKVIFILIFFQNLFLIFIAEAETTTLIWRNKEEFEAGGWYYPGSFDMVGYDKPSSFQSRDGSDLSPLDADSSHGVWSGSKEMDKYYFKLRRDHPSLCNFTQATITIKIYFTRFTSVYINSCRNESCSCMCKPSLPSGVQWTTQEFSLDDIRNDEIIIEARMQNANYFKPVLLDEVRITHNGQDCVEPTAPTTPATVTTEEPHTTPTAVPTTTTKTTPTPHPDPCEDSCGYTAIDCHEYYSCHDNSISVSTCPKSLGLAFNPELGVCDWMENVKGCEPPCTCEYRPNIANCSQYYFCPDSCQEELCELRSCPQGLLWSVQGHGGHSHDHGGTFPQCTLPEIAKCAEDNLNDS